MKTITGDLLDIQRGVICHQVNCIGVMGGLAGAIREKWPIAFEHYHQEVLAQAKVGDLLGHVQLVPVGKDLIVANIFGQKYIKHGIRQTDYPALAQAASTLSDMQKASVLGDLPIYLPFNMGCGLGGGTWSVVQGIFEPYDWTWVRKY